MFALQGRSSHASYMQLDFIIHVRIMSPLDKTANPGDNATSPCMFKYSGVRYSVWSGSDDWVHVIWWLSRSAAAANE